MALNPQSLSLRIGLGLVALMLSVAAGVGASVVVGLHGMNRALAASADGTARVESVLNMQIAQLEATSSIRNAGLATNARVAKAELTGYEKALQHLKAEEARFAALQLDASTRASLERVVAQRKAAEPVLAEAVEQVLALAGEEAARTLSARYGPLHQQWVEQLRALVALEQQAAQRAVATIEEDQRQRFIGLAAVLAACLAGLSLMALVLTRSLTRRLRSALQLAQQVARGELTLAQPAAGGDELAQLLRAMHTMVRELHGMVQAVRHAAHQVGSASADISQGNLDLSERTERQAAALEQTSASLAELAAAVSTTSGHADVALGLAERTEHTARDAAAAMSHVAQRMSRISESSQRIAEIIGVIDGIAFQTNILALNAAVEAARAGEQGRGFAVVASEVRSLAQRVTEASGEVRTLITESAVRVQDGSSQVTGMADSLQALVDGVESVKVQLAHIASNAGDQRQGIAQVNLAVGDIDRGTQHNAALVQQLTATTTGLVTQAQVLNAAVGRFELGHRNEARPEHQGLGAPA